MHKLMSHYTAWKMNQTGATAIEYGLIAAGISVAIVVIVFTLGGKIQTAFTTISNAIH